MLIFWHTVVLLFVRKKAVKQLKYYIIYYQYLELQEQLKNYTKCVDKQFSSFPLTIFFHPPSPRMDNTKDKKENN